MRLSQVLKRLRKEGYVATSGRIRCAINNGYLQPPPEKTARGAYNYTPEHIKQLRRYFINVRPGPRPRTMEELPVCGASDRLHRLAERLEARASRLREQAYWRQLRELEARVNDELEQLRRRLQFESYLSSLMANKSQPPSRGAANLRI